MILDERLIRVLHAAGLREISFGVESPDPLSAQASRASLYTSRTHAYDGETLLGSGTQDHGVLRDWVLQDTEESIEELIRFACDLDTTYANFKILTPYPGTPQFNQLKHLVFETDWEKFDGYTLTFNHPTLTPRRARLMLGMAYSRFIGRPSQLFNWLRAA